MLSKVFKAYDVRAKYPDPLSEQVAWKVGCAAGRFLRSQIKGRDASDPMLQHVVVGRDMRPHSPKLAEALIDGLRAAPVNVIDVGMVDTSFIYFAINHLRCAGGVMTTASHNPIEYNGFKISGLHAKPIGADTGLVDIQRIAATIEGVEPMPAVNGRVEERDLWADYRKHVLQFLKLSRPLRVVIDASNGMAGKMVPEIFGKVQGLEIIPLNFKVGGKFAHEPNPLEHENMVPTQEAVRKNKADFGICFDGDADRGIICDEQGNLVGCDLLGAMMSGHFLASSPGAAVVYDLRSSLALAEAVKAAGGVPVRSRVGHVFMKQAMRENSAVFGAELSGHFYFRDSFNTDSGAITFATVMTILSSGRQSMSSLIKPHRKYLQSGELNFQVIDKDAAIRTLKKTFKKKSAEHDELDGVTIDLMAEEGWWCNVRKSNTEPFLRLNLEAKDAATLDATLQRIRPMMSDKKGK